MAVLSKKVNGATLIEMLVALSVFTLCISIGSLTLASVMKLGGRQKILRAEMIVARIAKLKPDTIEYSNGQVFINELLIEKKLVPSIHPSRCVVVEYTAKDNKGRILATIRQIISLSYDKSIHP